MRRLRNWTGAMVALAALAVIAPLAFGSSHKSGAGNIVVSDPTDWATMDHQVSVSGNMWWETGGYDRLTEHYNGRIVPYLATKWKVAPDNKSVTFTLRKGVKCQNGASLTPRDVAASFTRLFTVPKKGDNLGAAFGAGPLTATANTKRDTLTIRTQTAFGGLVSGTASGAASIVCPNGLTHGGAQLQTGFYGSGPYKLVKAVHASQVILVRNPKWTWGPVINGKEITWKDLPARQTWQLAVAPQTLFADLLTGSVQVGGFSNGPQVAQLSHNKNFTLTRLPGNFPATLVFQFGPGHSTDSPALRQALSLLVDPTSLMKAFNAGGKSTPLVTSFVQPFQQCYDPKTKKLYPSGGLSKAKQVLAAAGYTGIGSNLTAPTGTAVTLRIVTSPTLDGNAGPYLQQAFSSLGANVQLLNTTDISALTNATYGGQEDVTVSANQTNSDPSLTSSIIGYFAGAPLSQGGLNVFGPPASENPTWTQLINSAFASRGCKAWDRLQEYALTSHIMLPIAEADFYNVARRGTHVSAAYFAYEPWSITTS